MHFRDRGIIISKKPFKESSCIVTIFTEKHGIYSGYLRQYNKKTGDNLAEGNLVDFFWSARLHEHIGYAKCELIQSFSSYIMTNKIKLYAFNSIVSLLKIAFCEREPHNNLFPSLLAFITTLKTDFLFAEYIKLELNILSEAGYQLQLNNCAVTGTSGDLYYVSPKSGKAVSKITGEAYKDKLLKLPKFLTDEAEIDNAAINDALNLTSYFFSRYILQNRPEPAARISFVEYIKSLYT